MAVEQDELKLSVLLDDQASQQLQQLQAQLNTLVSAGGPASKSLQDFADKLKDVGGHASKLHGSLAGTAARGGLIAGFFLEVGRSVEHMGRDFLNATLNIKAYTDSVVTLGVAADRASISSAQFAQTIADMRASGIGAAEAGRMIQGFADAIADLQRIDSPLEAKMLSGLVGPEFDDMVQLLQHVKTKDRLDALEEVKQYGEDLRAYQTQLYGAETGSLMQRRFYKLWGIDDIDKLTEKLARVTPELKALQQARMENAERYQKATERTKDSWERSVQSVQATAFRVLPIRESAEGIAGLSDEIAHWFEEWEGHIHDANEELESKQNADSGFWFDLFQKLGLAGGKTRGQEIEEGAPSYEPQGPQQPKPEPPKGPETWHIPTPGAGGAHLLGGDVDVDGGGSPGSPVDIPDISKMFPNADASARGQSQLGKTGSFQDWLAQPGELSGNILDLRNESAIRGTGDVYEDNTVQIGLLATEVRRVNDVLTPTILKYLGQGPEFHNAPQGGARGESNPIKLPSGAKQPGGGSAAEAAETYKAYSSMFPYATVKRGWNNLVETAERAGVAVKDLLQQATPLIRNPEAPPRDINLTGVGEGTGMASWYGNYAASPMYTGKDKWLDPGPGGDPAGSAALGKALGMKYFPEERQGISTSDPQGLGSFHLVTTPEGNQYKILQTDVGPGKSTGKILDVAGPAAEAMGKTRRDMENAKGLWSLQNTDAITSDEAQLMTRTIQRISPAVPVMPRLMETLKAGREVMSESENAPQDPLHQYQRAVERVEPGSDEEWALRTERALKGGTSFSESENAVPPRGYDKNSGMGAPLLQDEMNTYGLMPDAPLMEEMQNKGGIYRPQFDPMTGRNTGASRPINLDANGSKLDTGIIDRDANDIEVNQSGALKVNVEAPEGTSVRAEGDGVFDKTETNRQMAY